MIKQILVGHTSPETAYVVNDYPYGFRLRCKIRYWIETKKGYGQRLVSQTTNPKRDGDVWNKPKAGQYFPLIVMYLDEKNHVEYSVITGYDASEEKLDQFERDFASALQSEWHQSQLKIYRAMIRASKRVTWEVVTRKADEAPGQTIEEQRDILRKLAAIELGKMNKGEK